MALILCHIKLLTEVLQLLQKHQLVVNKKKSSFGIQSVKYLGHIIDGRGVSMDPAKIESIRNWPTLKNVKAVRGFMGLTGYYRKFIEGASAPVLALPNFSQPFEIKCDASGRGIRAVLMQSQRPIAYFSKALSDQNLNKSAYEKEIMALVLAIPTRSIIHYFTDQKSLKFLLEQRKENRVADALSRIPKVGELCSMVAYPQWLDGTQLLDGLKDDPQLPKIVQDVTNDPQSRPGFSLVNGKLYHKERLVIPATSPWIPQLLEEFHSSPNGGHSGFYRTYRRLASRIYWLGMTKSVREFVRACDTCQRYKSSTLSPAGLLQPLPIPDRIWEDISIDFITGLPKSKGYEVILVVVDRLSKYCHFIPLKRPFTARSLAEVFLKEVIRLHGIPKSVLSDRDPLFLSTLWKEIFSLQGSKLKFSSTYHPETDGQTEVVNRILKTYLCCFTTEQLKNWSFWLPWAEFWHNTSFHVSTNTTPFEVVYRRALPTLLKYVPGEIHCEAVATDKHRREVEFAIRDWVFLKLRPHRQQSVVRRIHQKLAAHFYGPFLIIDKIGNVAYKLQLPESSKIHPVFHVSLLKHAVGNHPVEPTLPQGLEMDSSTPSLPEKCLAVREVTKKGEKVPQWLIQWQQGTIEDATWEDAYAIQNQFPNFRLEDKPVSYEADIDKENDNIQPLDIPNGPGTWKVYKRKRFKKGQVKR
ncbi:retrotransposon-related protein [Tanacetum coccineum]